jgi:hypothetical protein
MKRAAIVTALLLAGQAGPSRAQGAAGPVQQLLKGAANPADFADVSTGGVISLKHKPSGVVCTFEGDPQGASLHSGPTGVMCNSATPYELDALEVFLEPNATDADAEAAIPRALGAVQDPHPVNNIFDDLKADRPGAPPHAARRYIGTLRGARQVYARVAWAQVGDWFIFQRVIAGLDGAKATDAEAEKKLLAAIGQAMDNRPSAKKPKGR